MSFMSFSKTNRHFLTEKYSAGKSGQLILTLMFKIMRISNSCIESKSSLLRCSFSFFPSPPIPSLCELY